MEIYELINFANAHPDNFSITLKRKHPGVYNLINKMYAFDTFAQKLYHYVNVDVHNKCEICNNVCKFDGYHVGYRKRCSYRCMADAKKIIAHETRSCVICNNSFVTYIKKEKTTCSPVCLLELNKSAPVESKRRASLKKSLMDKYGVDHPSKIPGFRDKYKKTKLERHGDENYVNPDKAKVTKKERYGDETYNNLDLNKKTKLERYNDQNYNNRQKFIKTNVERYGVEYPMQNEEIFKKSEQSLITNHGGIGYSSPSIAEKINKTNIEKYGYEIATKNKDVSDKLRRTWYNNVYDNLINSDRLENKILPLFSKEEYFGSKNAYPFKCLACNTDFIGKIEDGKIPRCTTCFPIIRYSSKAENEIVEYLINLGIKSEEIVLNDRKILGGKELDIYIPSRNVAIEYDGVIWHSEFIGEKSRSYHLNKTVECERLGIKLIHIFENEWISKQEIVKSRLKHILKYNYDSKVYAKKCDIRIVSSDEKREFLSTYHLQGDDRSSICVGAYYNNELVAVMTFGKLRVALGNKKTNEGEFEMYRFCVNRSIIGIASKLLSFFIKNYNPKKIITFADRRYSNISAFYSTIGFSFVSFTPPNYFYFSKNDPYTLYHRFNFRKDQLSKKLELFDPNLTEWDNMKNNGYDRIWDCGHIKYELVLS